MNDCCAPQYVFDTLGNFRTVKLRNGQTEFYQHDGQYRLVSLFLGSVLQYRRLYAEKDRIVAKVNNSGYLSEGNVHGVRGQTPEYLHKNSQKYGFAGGIYLASSKVFKFGARIYDPLTGRWLAKDPIHFHGGDANLYGYVPKDLINFTDPSGFFTEKFIKERTTPNEQLTIGVAASSAGIACLKAGLSSLNLPLTLTGAALAYEGAKNIMTANERGAPQLPNLLPGN